MQRASISTFLAVTLALGAGAAGATVPGIGTSACVLVWEGITGTPGGSTKKAKTSITCIDGDATCDGDGAVDGSCRFTPQLCVNQAIDGCTTGPIDTLGIKPAEALAVGELKGKKGTVVTALSLPDNVTGTADCGAAGQIDVPLKTTKSGKQKKSKKVVITASSKSPKTKNTVSYICNPSTDTVTKCDPNPDGPDQARFVIRENGDLDNGWSGFGHNFPNNINTTAITCLSNCNATDDPTCDANGPVGDGSVNGATFGPPLALLAGTIPVCVRNGYKSNITGTVNLQTGEVDGVIPLNAKVFLTSTDSVCPRCSGDEVGSEGKCDSGPRQGKTCVTESITIVAGGTGNTTYKLSRDCPQGPSGGRNDQDLGTLDIPLPLKTGLSSSEDIAPGPTPCTDKSLAPAAPNPQPDACDGTCDAQCTGEACLTMVDGKCIDKKGGISQLCCSDNTQTPCHPLASGPLVRQGETTPPTPAWPDPSYPKSGDMVAVGVFCEAATTSNTLNSPNGLPGPGAVILPMTQTYEEIAAE